MKLIKILSLPNQALPATKQRGKQARLVQSRRPENAIARSAIQIKGTFIITRSVILIIFNGRPPKDKAWRVNGYVKHCRWKI